MAHNCINGGIEDALTTSNLDGWELPEWDSLELKKVRVQCDYLFSNIQLLNEID